MFETNVVEKLRTHMMVNSSPTPTPPHGPPREKKSCRLREKVEKSGTARQAEDDDIIWLMPSVGWISKATDTKSQFVIRIAFPRHQWLRERALMLR
jgi:hypothetical protein